ncbi:MAG: C10 family peptidase [Bacteroidaceae bacterium]|nr:C10 family peptidase [Bacteroidaceae bacterium]
MRKLLLLGLLATAITASAEKRSLSELQQMADSHFAQTADVKGMTAKGAALTPHAQLAYEDDALAAFDDADHGAFVLLSKSDRTEAVVGYADRAFPKANMPTDLQWFIATVGRNISEAERCGTDLTTTRRRAQGRTAVEPFVTTLWHQADPFNMLTPYNHPAGCVAVAMAQCINYCRYPSSVNFRGYCYAGETATSGRLKLDSLDIKGIYFYPFLDMYGRAKESQKKSVATLVRDCGYATYMQYAKGGSGTYTYQAGIALTTIFGYPEESIKYAERDCFGGSQDDWNNIIYDEMERRSPIIYGAQDSTSGGHAFVFCGLDAEGLVYVNWGWGGDGDGFYDITLLDPPGMSFNFGHGMVYGIRSKALPTDKRQPRIYSYDGMPYTFNFAKETGDDGKEHVALHITFNAGMYNQSPVTMDGEFGLFGTDLTTGKAWQIRETDADTWAPGVGYFLREPTALYYYYVENDLIPGHKYRISFGSRDKIENEWHSIICADGEVGYEIDYTGDAETTTVSERMQPLYDGIGSISTEDKATITRVFDTTGRLIYSCPTPQFNLWDVPAHGILIVKQGEKAQKVVKG